MKLLVVDDEVELLDLVSDFLSIKGHQVITASDGDEALINFYQDTSAFDAILTDHRMPKMSGLELIKKLRGDGYGLPVVVMSGDITDLSAFCVEHESVYLLQKPMSLANIACLLEEIESKQNG